MPKNYDTSGKLVGNVPYDLTSTTPANRSGGISPGVAQPDGTKLMAFGEGGNATSFNRAFLGISRQSDLQQMIHSWEDIIPCSISDDLITGLDMSLGASANVVISTLETGSIYGLVPQVQYMFAGLYNRRLGTPVALQHNVAASAREGQLMEQEALSNIVVGGSNFWPDTVTEDDDIPTKIAAPVQLGQTGVLTGTTLFERDGLVGINWYTLNCLVGAYVQITGPINPGWYQVIEITDGGLKAVLAKTAVKTVPVDGWSGANWANTEGYRIQDVDPAGAPPANPGKFFYVISNDQVNDLLHLYPFTGSRWVGAIGQVGDIHALVNNATLYASDDNLIFCDVDLSGTNTVEDVGEPLVLDTSLTSGTQVTVYCPPGFVPLGTTVTVDLLFANPIGGFGQDIFNLLCGLYAPTEDAHRTLQEVGYALPNTHGRMEAILGEARLNTISTGNSTSGDRKIRVVAHSADAWHEEQIAVYNSATPGVVTGWINQEGWWYNAPAPGSSENVAPFAGYKSLSVSVQRNIIEQQALNELSHTGRLLTDPGFSTAGGVHAVDAANDFWVTSAGAATKVSGAAGIVDSGPAWTIDTTYFIYYVGATGAIAAIDAPGSITFSDLADPAGATPYGSGGGDVLIGWFTTTGGGDVLEVESAWRHSKSESQLSLTVGTGTGCNFETFNEAVGFIKSLGAWITAGGGSIADFSFKCEIRMATDMTVTEEIELTGIPYPTKIDGDGRTLTWTPAAAQSLFRTAGNAADLEICNMKVTSTWAVFTGDSFLECTTAAAPTTLNKVYLHDIEATGASNPLHFFYSLGAGTKTLKYLHIENVTWLSDEAGIDITDVVGTHYIGEYHIENFNFTAGTTAAEYGIFIKIGDDAAGQGEAVARREIVGCTFTLNTNPGGPGDVFDYGIYIDSAYANNTLIKQCRFYEADVVACWLDAPGCKMEDCYAITTTGTPGGGFVYLADVGCVMDGCEVVAQSGAAAAVVVTAADCIVSNSRFDFSAGSVGRFGVDLNAVTSVRGKVLDCVFLGKAADLSAQAINISGLDSEVRGNSFEDWDATGAGGIIGASSAGAAGFLIADNVVKGSSKGRGIAVSAAISPGSIIGNKIIVIDGDGINLANAATSAIHIIDNYVVCSTAVGSSALFVGAGVNRCNIVGNTFAHTAAGQTAPTVDLDGANMTFTNNRVTGTGVAGVTLFMNNAMLGANVSSNVILNANAGQTADTVTYSGGSGVFSGNRVEAGGVAAVAFACTGAAAGSRITGNTFMNTNAGQTAATVTLDGNFGTFSGNYAEAVGRAASAVAVAATAANNVLANNNCLNLDPAQTSATVSVEGTFTTVTGNDIVCSFEAAGALYTLIAASHTVITGNNLICTDLGGAPYLRSVLEIQGDQTTVTGNIVYGKHPGTAVTDSMIAVGFDARDCIVMSNVIDANGAAGVLVDVDAAAAATTTYNAIDNTLT